MGDAYRALVSIQACSMFLHMCVPSSRGAAASHVPARRSAAPAVLSAGAAGRGSCSPSTSYAACPSLILQQRQARSCSHAPAARRTYHASARPGFSPHHRGVRTCSAATAMPDAAATQLSGEQRVQLIAGIAQASSYQALHLLVRRCGPPSELDPTVAAYAMLQAANLRDTTAFEELEEADTFESVLDVIEARDELIEILVPCLERNASSYPPSIQVTLASALAQLDEYSESLFSAIATTCCELGDATGGMAQAAQDALSRAAQASPVSVVIEPTTSTTTTSGGTRGKAGQPASASSSVGGEGSPGQSVEYGALAIQLMMTSSAYALVGHHDQQLFDLIANQTVRYMDSISDMPTLINILCAFMDVYHRDRELLEAAGMKLADHIADLQPADAVSVLLVYAVFKVRNPQFYEALLDVASRLDVESVDPKTVAALYRAIKLLPEPVPIPPAVEALLSQSMDKFGMLALSVTSSAVASLPTLLRLEEAEDEETLSTMQGLRMEDILVRRELYALLTQVMGLKAVRNYSVTQDGWLSVHIAVQFQDYNIGFIVMKDGTAYLRNDPTTLRGQVGSEIRCIQQEGWIAVVLEVDQWQSLLAEVAEAQGEAEHGEEGEETEVDSGRLAELLAQRITDAIRRMEAESGQ